MLRCEVHRARAPHPCTHGGGSPHHAQVWDAQGKGSGCPSLCGSIPHYAQVWVHGARALDTHARVGGSPHRAQVWGAQCKNKHWPSRITLRSSSCT